MITLVEQVKNFLSLNYETKYIGFDRCRGRAGNEWKQASDELKKYIPISCDHAFSRACQTRYLVDALPLNHRLLIYHTFWQICFSETETKCYTSITRLRHDGRYGIVNVGYVINLCVRDVLPLYENRLQNKQIPILKYLGDGKYLYVVLKGIKLVSQEGYIVEDREESLVATGKTKEEAQNNLIKKRVIKFASSL